MPLIKGRNLNDLHFGHHQSERMYNELEMFKDDLRDNEVHILVLDGDYFDRKLTASEPAIFYAVSFFSELVEICKEKNIAFRVVQGTRSHDLNQIFTLFQHYENDPDLDIKFIEKVSEEKFMGMDILYIPEEYPEDVDEYYKEYKEKEYSMVCGHGTWDFVAFDSQIEKSKDNSVHSAPIFIYKEWKNAVKNGFISFGHIHGRNRYGQKIFYSGSFTRWNYVELSEKGYTQWEYDTDKKEYKVDFIDNKQAPSYEIISLKGMFHGLELKDIEIETIKEMLDMEATHYDNVRIDLSGLTDDRVAMLKEAYVDAPNIRVEVRDKKALLKENLEPAIYEKYSYILKRELGIPETVQRFALEEKQETLTIEKINEILKPIDD